MNTVGECLFQQLKEDLQEVQEKEVEREKRGNSEANGWRKQAVKEKRMLFNHCKKHLSRDPAKNEVSGTTPFRTKAELSHLLSYKRTPVIVSKKQKSTGQEVSRPCPCTGGSIRHLYLFSNFQPAKSSSKTLMLSGGKIPGRSFCNGQNPPQNLIKDTAF